MDKLFVWQLDDVKFSSLSSKYTRFIPHSCEKGIQNKHNHLFSFLYSFRVEKSNYFRRDGADVHTDAEISLAQALLGGTIRIQGVYETQTIQVTYQ